jgi:transketolase
MSRSLTENATDTADVLKTLQSRAWKIRRNVLEMARGRGDGYVGQGLGAADILAVLYFHEMRYDPAALDWPDRDRFLLSTGHYSIVLFAALTELGVFPEDELRTYGADESRFEMSTCITTPGVEITGGSLGHGLPQAVGMALGSRLSGRNFRVFNFLSDGEVQEGATWEAAMSAGHYGLENLVAIVDVNNTQADGSVSDVMTIEPLTRKWEAFGWHAQGVDGNSIPDLLAAFEVARNVSGRPKVLVCYTRMGKGVPLIEERPRAHFIQVGADEWAEAIRQLEGAKA